MAEVDLRIGIAEVLAKSQFHLGGDGAAAGYGIDESAVDSPQYLPYFREREAEPIDVLLSPLRSAEAFHDQLRKPRWGIVVALTEQAYQLLLRAGHTLGLQSLVHVAELAQSRIFDHGRCIYQGGRHEISFILMSWRAANCNCFRKRDADLSETLFCDDPLLYVVMECFHAVRAVVQTGCYVLDIGLCVGHLPEVRRVCRHNTFPRISGFLGDGASF